MNLSPNKNFCLIVNPHGGRKKGLHLLSEIQPIFDTAGIKLEVIVTEFAGHAREIAKQKDLVGYDGMIVIGGDGTMHEILNGLFTREDQQTIPIGLIPGGSGNSLIVDLELTDPVDAAKAIVDEHIRKFDVVEITTNGRTVYSFNIIGWGLVTDVGIRAEKWRWLGPARYTIVSLLKVLRGTQARSAQLILDGKEIADEFTFVMVCNTRYTGAMKIAPQAKLDDGLLDVIVLRHGASRLKLLSLFNRIYDGTHVEDPVVEYYTASQISLTSNQADPLNIDGELTGTTPFDIEVRPRAIEMFDRRKEKCQNRLVISGKGGQSVPLC
ncbi:diacylglycerol/lipid kinase family protein [Aporhodopirellula aestuarii]|uniref:Diacylglycerol kinase family lipid kinase n=1 Tax=Aporhodopirellula aestuarii TaxID=2950107 RepID=A0ABT0U729_9BACT|nr:diacylglycerol kinase family protein [Aporhodopirellula aestuarii]MCM2372763.1 diacylglycerol kinase family lipid kinase [Aporhodopirellula aestuarii]